MKPDPYPNHRCGRCGHPKHRHKNGRGICLDEYRCGRFRFRKGENPRKAPRRNTHDVPWHKVKDWSVMRAEDVVRLTGCSLTSAYKEAARRGVVLLKRPRGRTAVKRAPVRAAWHKVTDWRAAVSIIATQAGCSPTSVYHQLRKRGIR